MGKNNVKLPKPPDLTPFVELMREQGARADANSQRQMEWAREQDVANRAIQDRVLGIQLPAMEEQAANAREDRARYENVFQPAENDLIEDFQTFDSPERKAMERGRAAADVTQSFDAARRNALQRLEGYGVDPSQTRNAAMDLGVRSQQAAATAAAMTNANRNVEDKARALRADVVNIGRGGLSNVASSYGQAVAAGSGALGGANQTFATSGGQMGSPTQWAGLGMQGVQNAMGGVNQGFQNQMTQYNAGSAADANTMSGIGSLVGMGMMMDDGGTPRRRALSIGHIADGPGDGTGIDDQAEMEIVNPKDGSVMSQARVSPDEYIIPADVVRKKGIEFFDKLVQKYHTPANQQRADMRRALPA